MILQKGVLEGCESHAAIVVVHTIGLHCLLILPKAPIKFNCQMSKKKPLGQLCGCIWVIMARKKQQLESRMFKRNNCWCLNAQWKEGLRGEMDPIGGESN